jgi:hypothetical protein
MIYIPYGKTITVDTKSIKSKELYVWWLNPRTSEVKIQGLISNNAEMDFTTPSLGFEKDWVLIIDNPEFHYSIPFLK